MGIKKTLGGDRIGSGNKMEVELRTFSSSSHNVTKVTKTNQAAGTIVPIFKRLLLKDNKLDIDLNALAHTMPTEGPLFGDFELQLHVYSAPLRLYQGRLHMNMIGEGTKMEDIKFPLIEYETDLLDLSKPLDNQQMNPSCIFSYLGDRGIGRQRTGDEYPGNVLKRKRNANAFLMYHDVNANFYVNKQEGIGAIIHSRGDLTTVISGWFGQYGGDMVIVEYRQETPTVTGLKGYGQQFVFKLNNYGEGSNTAIDDISLWIDGKIKPLRECYRNITYVDELAELTGPGYVCEIQQFRLGGEIGGWQYSSDEGGKEPKIFTFPLENYNEMRMDILAHVKNSTPFIINKDSIAPFGTSLGKVGGIWAKTVPMEGLALRTYKSDWFNNWLESEAIESINERTRMMVDGQGGITMEAFLISEKMYRYFNAIQLAGNTVDDFEEAVWGTKSKRPIEKPMFEGAYHARLTFNEVLNQSATEERALGSQAATGTLKDQRGGNISVKVDEASLVMVVASIVPIPDYSQGNDWDGDLLTYEDLHSPMKDKIGFQDLLTDWMATWDTEITENGDVIKKSVGKQPSWTQYQTNINQTYGSFANSEEEWMVMNRRYEWDADTEGIKDMTTYIDPAKWNFPFAVQERRAMNFRMQYLIEAKQRILMSANQIPGL